MSPFIGCCHPPAAWGIEAIPRFVEVSEGLLVNKSPLRISLSSVDITNSFLTIPSLIEAAWDWWGSSVLDDPHWYVTFFTDIYHML